MWKAKNKLMTVPDNFGTNNILPKVSGSFFSYFNAQGYAVFRRKRDSQTGET